MSIFGSSPLTEASICRQRDRTCRLMSIQFTAMPFNAMSSLIVAHHHYFDPPSWPLQYPTKEVLLLMAVDLQLVVIVIFTSAIMPAICNHDCWHHHYHDITQNLAGKLFLCDNGLDNSGGGRHHCCGDHYDGGSGHEREKTC